MTDHHPPDVEHELTLRLDHASDVPLYRQIVDQVWLRVIEGELESGRRLPTVRQLSIQLGVNPRSVERAYQELEIRGVVATTRGSGTFVCLKQPDGPEMRRLDQLDQLCRETASRAHDFGFSIDELTDALQELRRTRGSKESRED